MSVVLHELKTPLHAILGLSDILLSGSKGDMSDGQQTVRALEHVPQPQQRWLAAIGILAHSQTTARLLSGANAAQLVSNIQQSGNRLLSLVNNLLDAAMMEKNAVMLSLGPVDIRQKVAEVIAVQRALLDARVALVDAMPDALPEVEADGERILQIVHNLAREQCRRTGRG